MDLVGYRMHTLLSDNLSILKSSCAIFWFLLYCPLLASFINYTQDDAWYPYQLKYFPNKLLFPLR